MNKAPWIGKLVHNFYFFTSALRITLLIDGKGREEK